MTSKNVKIRLALTRSNWFHLDIRKIRLSISWHIDRLTYIDRLSGLTPPSMFESLHSVIDVRQQLSLDSRCVFSGGTYSSRSLLGLTYFYWRYQAYERIHWGLATFFEYRMSHPTRSLYPLKHNATIRCGFLSVCPWSGHHLIFCLDYACKRD